MSIQTKLANFAFVTVMNPTFYVSNNGVKGNELFSLDSLRISNFTQEGPTKTYKAGLHANTVLRYGKKMRLEMEDVIGKIDALTALMGVVEKTAGVPVPAEVESFLGDGVTKTFYLSHTITSIGSITVDSAANTDYAFEGNAVMFKIAPGNNLSIIITYAHTPTASYAVTDLFNNAVYIEGTTFVINSTNGNKEWIKINIPNFLPDSLFNVTLESEGDFGVISIAGEIQPNECGEFYFLGDETNHTC